MFYDFYTPLYAFFFTIFKSLVLYINYTVGLERELALSIRS